MCSSELSATSCVRLDLSRTFCTFFLTWVASGKKRIFSPVKYIDLYAALRRHMWPEGRYIYIYIYIYIFPLNTFGAALRRINLYVFWGYRSYFLTCDPSEKKRSKSSVKDLPNTTYHAQFWAIFIEL